MMLMLIQVPSLVPAAINAGSEVPEAVAQLQP